MKATPEEIRRKGEVKIWMEINEVTAAWAGEQLGVSPSAIRKWLFYSDTIKPENREGLLRIGFPPDLVPPGVEKKTGPRPKVPRFVRDGALAEGVPA